MSRMLWLTEELTAAEASGDWPLNTSESRLLLADGAAEDEDGTPRMESISLAPEEAPPWDEEEMPKMESVVLASACADAELKVAPGLVLAAAGLVLGVGEGPAS